MFNTSVIQLQEMKILCLVLFHNKSQKNFPRVLYVMYQKMALLLLGGDRGFRLWSPSCRFTPRKQCNKAGTLPVYLN